VAMLHFFYHAFLFIIAICVFTPRNKSNWLIYRLFDWFIELSELSWYIVGEKHLFEFYEFLSSAIHRQLCLILLHPSTHIHWLVAFLDTVCRCMKAFPTYPVRLVQDFHLQHSWSRKLVPFDHECWGSVRFITVGCHYFPPVSLQFTFPASTSSYTACWQRHVCVNKLPGVVTWQWNCRQLKWTRDLSITRPT